VPPRNAFAKHAAQGLLTGPYAHGPLPRI